MVDNSQNKCNTVTLGIIAFNEQLYLPALLDDLLKQTYDKSLIEVILVDGESNDATWHIMCQFQEKNQCLFSAIKTLKNIKRIQPVGWNIVIDNSTCDIILRIDAHARIPVDFVEKNVDVINSGEYVCGGPRENIIDNNSNWAKMLLDAEQSLFGSGIASYRNDTSERKYVKSVFHGAYRKEVFDSVGRFNESLIRTEDNELHYRIISSGYKICYDPSIRSFYQTRNTFKRMLKQKYQNGYWIGKTLFICPKCISLFHLVPLLFVMALVLSIIIDLLGFPVLLILLAIAYGLFVLINATICLIKSKNPYDIVLPFVFFSMHICYGIGTIVGIISKKN